MISDNNMDLMSPPCETVEKYSYMDRISAEVLSFDQPDFPLVHRFAKGIYLREFYMTKDSLWITKIHNTENFFILSQGSVSISNDGEKWEHLKAPYTGVTAPGTQRVIVVNEDTVWTTVHANPEDNHDTIQLEETLIRKHEIPPELMSRIPPVPIAQ